MSTYGTMQNRIADEIDRTDLSSQAALAIISAIKHYASSELWFKENRFTTDTVPDTEYYALPSDMIDIKSIRLSDGATDDDWVPIQRTHEYMDEHYTNPNNYTGYPRDYSVYDQMLRFGPVPDRTFTIALSMTQELSELSATADSNGWMTHGEETIRARAKWDLYTNIIKDFGEADRMKAVEIEAFQRLEARSEKYTSTGKTRGRL